jgi:hypothetical protein
MDGPGTDTILKRTLITKHGIGKHSADATIHLIALSTRWNTALSRHDPHTQ